MSTRRGHRFHAALDRVLELLAHARLLERHGAQLGQARQRLQLGLAKAATGVGGARRQRPHARPFPRGSGPPRPSARPRRRSAGSAASSARSRRPAAAHRSVITCPAMPSSTPKRWPIRSGGTPWPATTIDVARIGLVAQHHHRALDVHDAAGLRARLDSTSSTWLPRFTASMTSSIASAGIWSRGLGRCRRARRCGAATTTRADQQDRGQGRRATTRKTAARNVGPGPQARGRPHLRRANCGHAELVPRVRRRPVIGRSSRRPCAPHVASMAGRWANAPAILRARSAGSTSRPATSRAQPPSTRGCSAGTTSTPRSATARSTACSSCGGKHVAAAAQQRDEERSHGIPPHWNNYVTVSSATTPPRG